MKNFLAGLTLVSSFSAIANDCTVRLARQLNYSDSGNSRIIRALEKRGFVISNDINTARFHLNIRADFDVEISTNSCDDSDSVASRVAYTVGLVEVESRQYYLGQAEDKSSFFGCAKKSKAISKAISQLPTCLNF